MVWVVPLAGLPRPALENPHELLFRVSSPPEVEPQLNVGDQMRVAGLKNDAYQLPRPLF